jgi:hypothetical protein
VGWTITGFEFREGRLFSVSSKIPDWLWGPHSLLVSMYWPSSLGMKRPGREPNNSPVSSADVMMLSTQFLLALRFQLNEHQKVKAVRVSGTDMCGKEWACGSVDWYSAVGEG